MLSIHSSTRWPSSLNIFIPRCMLTMFVVNMKEMLEPSIDEMYELEVRFTKICLHNCYNLTSHMFATNFRNNFKQTTINQNDELKKLKLFSLRRLSTTRDQISWSELNHPTIRDRQKDPLSYHELPLMPKALLLFSIFNYSKSIVFIALYLVMMWIFYMWFF